MEGFEHRGDVETVELAVCDGGDGGVKLLAFGQGVDYGEAVLALDGGGVGPGVVDGDVEVILFESFDDIDDFGVAHVGTVFFECETKHEDVAAEHLDAFLEHQLDDTVGNICAHAVVHAATGEDDLGVVAVALGALGQIIGIDADAVAADKTGLEGQEVPFGRGCLEHIGGVDAHEGEYLG